jgi:LPS sulfotransferase NodH
MRILAQSGRTSRRRAKNPGLPANRPVITTDAGILSRGFTSDRSVGKSPLGTILAKPVAQQTGAYTITSHHYHLSHNSSLKPEWAKQPHRRTSKSTVKHKGREAQKFHQITTQTTRNGFYKSETKSTTARMYFTAIRLPEVCRDEIAFRRNIQWEKFLLFVRRRQVPHSAARLPTGFRFEI